MESAYTAAVTGVNLNRDSFLDVLHELQIDLGASAQHGAPISHAVPRPTIRD